jgi:acyl-CoA thioesterase-1
MPKSIFIAALTVAAVFLILGCDANSPRNTPPAPVPAAYRGTIVAVGDSLTAGYGLIDSESYPAQLGKKLQKEGYNWRVVNAGISGETSSGTLSRVAWVLKLKPDIVILETGANDGLRGIDPQVTQKNLTEIVQLLTENRVRVVLAGMRMVESMGKEYTSKFAAIYPAVAKKHNLILIPFFLQGVAGDPALNQTDGIHPQPEGYRIIVDMIYPYVLKAGVVK